MYVVFINVFFNVTVMEEIIIIRKMVAHVWSRENYMFPNLFNQCFSNLISCSYSFRAMNEIV